MDDFEAPTLQDRIGRLGRYTLLAELAQGGMSRVFLARRDGSPTPCVLKQLHVELEHHPTAAKRFQREAHVIAHLDHPGIARLLGAGLEAGKFCIALEYVSGQTLEAVLERSRDTGRAIPPPIAIAIALRLLDALDYVHGFCDPAGQPLGLVHRDLSPGNVMIGYDGQVKLIDFGVAQARIDSFRTAPGMMVGTLRYMSPEQAATAKLDHRSDLYSVGAVLFELLTGQPVIARGKAVDVLDAILHRPAPSVLALRPDLPPALARALDRALEKDPGKRWPSAAAFREDLRTAAAPLGRAHRTHIGLLASQLFPDEELAFQRFGDPGGPASPFGAHDTEDFGESNRETLAAPRALPPLSSASLSSLDLVATVREDSPPEDPAEAFPSPPRSNLDLGLAVSGAHDAADTACIYGGLSSAERRVARLEHRIRHLEWALLGLAMVVLALASFAIAR